VCDVSDHGPGFVGGVPAPPGPPPPGSPGGRGLWLAGQFTDTLMIVDGPDGVTASVTVCLPAVTLPRIEFENPG
jgi:anti-sigma regulatory factor (Ser/Thr protein kinase)